MFFMDILEQQYREMVTARTQRIKGAINFGRFMGIQEEQIKDAIKHHSCKYAKKQYTYIKDIPGSYRIPFSGSDEDIVKVGELIKDFINEK